MTQYMRDEEKMPTNLHLKITIIQSEWNRNEIDKVIA